MLIRVHIAYIIYSVVLHVKVKVMNWNIDSNSLLIKGIHGLQQPGSLALASLAIKHANSKNHVVTLLNKNNRYILFIILLI